jgi:hypothetical protein
MQQDSDGRPGSAQPVEAPADKKCPVPKMARRLGVAAFAFFLIKGLVWLGLAGAAALGLMW